MRNFALVTLSAAVLAACGTRPPAPVVDRTVTPGTREPIVIPTPIPVPAPQPVVAMPAPSAALDTHTARRGETLFSIARLYNLIPRDLAQWNALPIDVVLREGQVLRLTAPFAAVPPTVVATPIPPAPTPPPMPTGEIKREPRAVKVPYTDEAYARIRGVPVPRTTAPNVAAPAPTGAASGAPVAPASGSVTAASTPAAAPAASTAANAPVSAPSGTNEADSITWAWPASGRITKKFSENSLLRGLSLEGRTGAPVFASAAGRVIYAGEGLRGYGKVVILRHNDQYTSVYGHNATILVKENETVKRGQKIAEVGDTETDSPKLHFEVRRSGKAVDPEKLLPTR